MGGTINPNRDASWQSSYIGRGAVQVTHQQGYARVVRYMKEASKQKRDEGDTTAADKLDKAAAAIEADPRQAANPEYTFLFSACYMKEVEGDKNMAGVGSRASFTGGGSESTWVTGGAKELSDRATGKSAAYSRAYPILSKHKLVEATGKS